MTVLSNILVNSGIIVQINCRTCYKFVIAAIINLLDTEQLSDHFGFIGQGLAVPTEALCNQYVKDVYYILSGVLLLNLLVSVIIDSNAFVVQSYSLLVILMSLTIVNYCL